MNLRSLSDYQLEDSLRAKAAEERRVTMAVITHLEEIDRRKLFIERGYYSLIDYCVQELKYSESSAYRRISAMRMVRDVPEAQSAIQSGALNLVSVAQVHSFLRAEAKADKPYAPEAKKKLLLSLQNKSTRETERILVELSPESVWPKNKVRQIPGGKTQMTITMTNEDFQNLERVKDLLSHKVPDGDYSELISEVIEIALDKIDPMKKPVSEAPRAKAPVAQSDTSAGVGGSPSRYISENVKRGVWQKSGGQCCYKDPQTGQRCSSTRYLEIDHRVAFSRGGENTVENLQLLCSTHNVWKGVRQI